MRFNAGDDMEQHISLNQNMFNFITEIVKLKKYERNKKILFNEGEIKKELEDQYELIN